MASKSADLNIRTMDDKTSAARRKIAIGYFGADDDISGVTTWLVALIKDFLAKGWEVHCIVQHFGKHRNQGALFKALHGENIQFHWLKGKSYADDSARKTLRYLEHIQPDLFFPQILVGFHHAALHGLKRGLPFLFTMHSDDPLYWGLLDELSRQGFSGPVICVSEHLLQKASLLYPDIRFVCIPYGVDTTQGRASYCNTPFRIVYSGRLVVEQKRILTVVSTMIGLCRKYPVIECSLLGEGNCRNRIVKMIAEAGLESRIHLKGRLGRDEVSRELNASQALLLLSDYEGLPLAVLEAMAVGVVPIARQIESGIPEIVREGETGYLVDDDSEDVFKAVGEMIANPDAWQSRSKASRELVLSSYSRNLSHLKWEALVEEMALNQGSSALDLKVREITLEPVNKLLNQYDYRTPPIIKRVYRRIRQLFL
jgi:glycosyltransferase involved in cell wall biosynthesis